MVLRALGMDQEKCAVPNIDRPTQAVILAGGRGTRLRPLTDTRPKPMVQVSGKPFVEYQIEQLREQGFTRVLLLLGYLPEVVQDYFGNGSRWGIRIDYSVTDIDDDTGRRVKLAQRFFDPYFMLLYCDNYWPMQIGPMWRRFQESGAPAMITAYSNKDGYTQNSVRVEPDGRVSIYDKSCSHPALNGVEISYAILKREVVDMLGDDNCLFETSVYQPLAEQGRLAGFVSDHRYYSVGSHRRLPLTEQFFQRTPTVILDRDGVLNRKPPRACYVRSEDELQWLPGALTALRLLRGNGYRVIVVSNQAGIGRGAMTQSDLDRVHRRMSEEAQAAGGAIDAFYVCPHDWDEGCECRKPKAGMLFQAQRAFQLDLSRTYFLGDDERDAAAARAASCRFMRVSEERPLLECVGALMHNEQRPAMHRCASDPTDPSDPSHRSDN
jgi:D-glycero-D-manno-heptose 1,7-bisphosphate phosphatase